MPASLYSPLGLFQPTAGCHAGNHNRVERFWDTLDVEV
jgi:hypothetical protein